MLTKKHIEQYAEYILEEYKVEKEISDYILQAMTDMYIKGYADCMRDDSMIMEFS